MRQALQLARKGLINSGHSPLCIRDKLNRTLAVPILLGWFASAHKIIWVWHWRTPMVGKSLEASKGKLSQILTRDAHNPKLAQCVEQKPHLILTQRPTQVNPRETHPRATVGQRCFAVCTLTKQRL
jgi:hypothetical protein